MTHAPLARTAGRFICTIATARIFGALVLFLASSPVLAAAGDVVDDGWRRTKDGWENISQWNLTAEERTLPSSVPLPSVILSPAAEQLMFLAHPVVIAVGIALLGGIALFSVSPPTELHADAPA